MKIFHYIVYFIFIGILLFPLGFEKFGNKENIMPLHGAYVQPDSIPLTWENWKSGQYQENTDSTTKYNMIIRPTLIRVYNEIDYKVFNKKNMGDLLVGEDDYMFSLGWTKSRAGNISLNEQLLDGFINKLKTLQNLLNQQNKFFLFIIPPSKEEVFSEYLPEKYKEEGEINDYKMLVSKLKKYHVNYIDLTKYYKDLQEKDSYPVYSKTSVHWTIYGAHFTTLMLLDSMNNFYKDSMPQLQVTGYDYETFKEGDGDHEKTLNLFSRIDNKLFAYPKYQITYPKSNLFKPNVIILGDSYYWGIMGSWQLLSIFSSNSKYLYYYNTVYPNNDQASYNINQLDIVNEFENANAFVMINSSHNLKGFPYGIENNIDSIISSLSKKHNEN